MIEAHIRVQNLLSTWIQRPPSFEERTQGSTLGRDVNLEWRFHRVTHVLGKEAAHPCNPFVPSTVTAQQRFSDAPLMPDRLPASRRVHLNRRQLVRL